MIVHHVAHGHHVQVHVRRPAGVPAHAPAVDPDVLHRWRTTGRLSAADVLAILADRDEGDPHPMATAVARLRAEAAT